MGTTQEQRLHTAEAAIAMLFVVGGLVAYFWMVVSGLGTVHGGAALVVAQWTPVGALAAAIGYLVYRNVRPQPRGVTAMQVAIAWLIWALGLMVAVVCRSGVS